MNIDRQKIFFCWIYFCVASAGQDDDGKADPAAGAGTSLISLDMDDDISDTMAPEEIAEVLVRRIPMPKDIDTLPYPHR